ncbi:MAG: SIS domain-containing protein [Anaerolineaceae bacterium]|nr:SIS domain-containing protein [Anaerolineaceae bacterium]
MNEEAFEALKNKNKREHHPFWIWESIMSTPKMLEECLAEPTFNQVKKVADKCIQKKVNKIFLLGTGSSYFATVAEKFAFEAYAGIQTSNYLTTEFREYPPIGFDDHSAVFFHSHSGGTKGDPETVQKVRDLGRYTVGITDIKESPLARCVDDSIIGPGGPKIELPATRTYSTAIFRMIQLAIELGKETRFQKAALEGEKQLKKIPGILENIVHKYAVEAPKIVDSLKSCRSFIVIGSGPNFATADECALGFSQSSGVASQAFQLENYLHGPIQTLRPDMGVILIAAPGPFQERILKTAEACKIIGAKVALLLPEGLNIKIDCDVLMELPANIPELLTPLLYMTPLWQVAYYFSLLGKGTHTDRLAMDKPEFKKAFSVIMEGDKKFVK